MERDLAELEPISPPARRNDVLVIVPAYNEAANLPRLLMALSAEVPGADILVINDGSSDATGQVAARTPGVAVVDLPFNLGIGAAVRTGFKYAARHGYAIAVQVDGDGQHKPDELDAILRPVREGTADMVIGSRFLSIQSYRPGFARHMGITLFEWVNSWLIGQRITDNTSGFRAYSRSAIAFLAQHYPSDYPEPEAVILLGKNHFRILEVPVAMQERQGGSSSITPLKSIYYMIKVLLAIGMCACREPLVKSPVGEAR